MWNKSNQQPGNHQRGSSLKTNKRFLRRLAILVSILALSSAVAQPFSATVDTTLETTSQPGISSSVSLPEDTSLKLEPKDSSTSQPTVSSSETLSQPAEESSASLVNSSETSLSSQPTEDTSTSLPQPDTEEPQPIQPGETQQESLSDAEKPAEESQPKEESVVKGVVFEDTNKNGKQDGEEKGIDGLAVALETQAEDGSWQTAQQASTAQIALEENAELTHGSFVFSGLPMGSYRVAVSAEETSAQNIALSSAAVETLPSSSDEEQNGNLPVPSAGLSPAMETIVPPGEEASSLATSEIQLDGANIAVASFAGITPFATNYDYTLDLANVYSSPIITYTTTSVSRYYVTTIKFKPEVNGKTVRVTGAFPAGTKNTSFQIENINTTLLLDNADINTHAETSATNVNLPAIYVKGTSNVNIILENTNSLANGNGGGLDIQYRLGNLVIDHYAKVVISGNGELVDSRGVVVYGTLIINSGELTTPGIVSGSTATVPNANVTINGGSVTTTTYGISTYTYYSSASKNNFKSITIAGGIVNSTVTRQECPAGIGGTVDELNILGGVVTVNSAGPHGITGGKHVYNNLIPIKISNSNVTVNASAGTAYAGYISGITSSGGIDIFNSDVEVISTGQGIGSSSGQITNKIVIDNSNITVKGERGSGIGSGSAGAAHASTGDITIKNNSVVKATGYYAGIGAGFTASTVNGLSAVGKISILDSEVTAVSTYGGAGIGNGSTGVRTKSATYLSIEIMRSTVYATSLTSGAGIGAGFEGVTGEVSVGPIKIQDSKVYAASACGSGYSTHAPTVAGIGGIYTRTRDMPSELISISNSDILAFSTGEKNHQVYPIYAKNYMIDSNDYGFSGVIDSRPTTSPVQLIIRETGTGKFIKQFPIPQEVSGFAYTTDTTLQNDYFDVFNLAGTQQLGVFVKTANLEREMLSYKNYGASVHGLSFYSVILEKPLFENITNKGAKIISRNHHIITGSTYKKGGFAISTDHNMPPAGSASIPWTQAYTETGDMYEVVNNLAGNTKYYAKTNLTCEPSPGAPVSLDTPVSAAGPYFVTLPDITRFAADNITPTGEATLNGTIGAGAAGGGQEIQSVKIYRNTTNDFTSVAPTVLNKTTAGTPASGQFTNTAFKLDLTGLTIGTKYYVKVVVSNQFTDAATSLVHGGEDIKELNFVAGLRDINVTVKNGTGGTAVAKIGGIVKTQGATGDTVTLEAVPAAGYFFKGWTVTAGGPLSGINLTSAATGFTMPANDVSIQAEFTKKTAMLDITIPTNLLFAATTAKSDGTIIAPVYTITSRTALFNVDVLVDGLTITSSAGVNLIPGAGPNAPTSSGESLWLYLKGDGTQNQDKRTAYGLTAVSSGMNRKIGQLAPGNSSPQKMTLKLGGKYYGNMQVDKSPKYRLTLKFVPQ